MDTWFEFIRDFREIRKYGFLKCGHKKSDHLTIIWRSSCLTWDVSKRVTNLSLTSILSLQFQQPCYLLWYFVINDFVFLFNVFSISDIFLLLLYIYSVPIVHFGVQKVTRYFSFNQLKHIYVSSFLVIYFK